MSRTPLGQLIRRSFRWTDATRRDAVATALLIADDGVEVHNAIFRGLREGRYRLDRKLVVDLYAQCTRPARLRLVASTAFGFLAPNDFEGRFLETYRSRANSARERIDLTGSLNTYLWRHPEREGWARPIILSLLRGARWDRVRGLSLARRLSMLDERDRELVRRSLRDRMFEIRINAHNLFFWWLKRKSELSPDLRAFCMSPEVRAIAYDRYRSDPTIEVKTCAYYFLKAREPRAGHKPPKGMPVPPPRRKGRRRRAP